MYYIVSGKFSLKSPHENRKDNLNTPYLEVIVTDSVSTYIAPDQVAFRVNADWFLNHGKGLVEEVIE